MEQQTAHSSVVQFKYFKILVQEFHVKLDIIFVNALIQLFTGSKAKITAEMVRLRKVSFTIYSFVCIHHICYQYLCSYVG